MRSDGGSAHPTRIRVTKTANLPPPVAPGKRSSCINETNSSGCSAVRAYHFMGDIGDHGGQSRRPGCDGEPRQLYAMDFCPVTGRFRQPPSVRCGKVDDHPNHRARFVREPYQADAAHLDQAGQRFGRPGQQPAMCGFKMNPVVRHQAREWKRTGSRHFNQFQRQPRFSGSGWPADQHSAGSDKDGRSVHRRGGRCHYGAGRRTMKRAPATVASPCSSGGPGLFSTQIAPPWASTICLEMERPSPEFWPKP
jgi:hypothetical protein